MKSTLKKISILFLIFIITITITGCGNKSMPIPNDSNKSTTNNENNNKEKDQDETVSLYSDNTKMVFNVGDVYYVVYYHDGVNVTGMEYIYNYPDAETAKFAETMLKATYEENDGVKSFKRSGKQIRIAFDEDTYRGLTIEQAKAVYSMYEEMYKN